MKKLPVLLGITLIAGASTCCGTIYFSTLTKKELYKECRELSQETDIYGETYIHLKTDKRVLLQYEQGNTPEKHNIDYPNKSTSSVLNNKNE